MLNLPMYIPLSFIIITFITLGFFYWTLKNSTFSHRANLITGGLLAWLALQGTLAYTGFFQVAPSTIPPPFIVVIIPTFGLILLLFNTKTGKAFIDGLPFKEMTYLSIIRIPVEIILYWLFLEKTIPELMTFAGRNFDIIAGITAPFIAYFGIKGGKINRPLFWAWNIMGLILLVNIIAHGILSAPLFFQQLAFDQPNIALMYFPFVWLAAFVAAVPLFLHLVTIRKLWLGQEV